MRTHIHMWTEGTEKKNTLIVLVVSEQLQSVYPSETIALWIFSCLSAWTLAENHHFDSWRSTLPIRQEYSKHQVKMNSERYSCMDANSLQALWEGQAGKNHTIQRSSLYAQTFAVEGLMGQVGTWGPGVGKKLTNWNVLVGASWKPCQGSWRT